MVPSDLSSLATNLLAAKTAVFSGRVPMVTFVHLLGTRPGTVLSRAD